jgi:hypothetical protein
MTARATALDAARNWLDFLDYDLSKETEDSELVDLIVAVVRSSDADNYKPGGGS